MKVVRVASVLLVGGLLGAGWLVHLRQQADAVSRRLAPVIPGLPVVDGKFGHIRKGDSMRGADGKWLYFDGARWTEVPLPPQDLPATLNPRRPSFQAPIMQIHPKRK